jgi:hypothetical protein
MGIMMAMSKMPDVPKRYFLVKMATRINMEMHRAFPGACEEKVCSLSGFIASFLGEFAKEITEDPDPLIF